MAFNEYGVLKRVALRHAREAFRSAEAVVREWQALGYPAPPDFGRAVAEYDRFAEILANAGAELLFLDGGDGLSLDSIYVRDASLVSSGGTILCHPGKAARVAEATAAGGLLAAAGETILGAIEGAGWIEGGDLVWLDEATCVVGLGYRTNAEGVAQLQALLGPGVAVVTVPLPHYRGPEDVFHLMSMLSPLDRDLALVCSPLMPVPFRQWLLERGMTRAAASRRSGDRAASTRRGRRPAVTPDRQTPRHARSGLACAPRGSPPRPHRARRCRSP